MSCLHDTRLGSPGTNGQWSKLLDRLTTDRLELPAKPQYVRSLDNRLMEKPCWNTLVSVVDATKISIRPNELSPSVCRWVQKLNRGKTFQDLVQFFVGQLSNRCDASIQAVCGSAEASTQPDSVFTLEADPMTTKPFTESLELPRMETVEDYFDETVFCASLLE